MWFDWLVELHRIAGMSSPIAQLSARGLCTPFLPPCGQPFQAARGSRSSRCVSIRTACIKDDATKSSGVSRRTVAASISLAVPLFLFSQQRGAHTPF